MARNPYCSLKAPSFFPDFVKFLQRGFFTHCPEWKVGFVFKSCGTDGKPTAIKTHNSQ
jgi:hypothetical protein